MSRPLRALISALIPLLVSSCTLVSGLGDFTFGDASTDADADTDSDAGHEGSTIPVDLLFVIDNTAGMEQVQQIFIDASRSMLRELVAPQPGDDGQTAPAVEDLHVGVITTDLGVLGSPLDADFCRDDPDSGDGGELQAQSSDPACQPRYSASDCQRTSCPWLSHSAAIPDDGTDLEQGSPIWEDFACIAALGTEGCGFEQPLEASLQALTVQSSPGQSNDQFLRDESLLVIVYLSNEDDCSARDPLMFAAESETPVPGPYGTRCAFNPELLHPMERYIEGFRELRGGADDKLLIAAIVGIPSDGAWSPGDTIDDLAVLQQPRSDDPDRLEPICDTSLGEAFPPVRIATLVQVVSNHNLIGSICQPNMDGLMSRLRSTIRGRMVVR